VTGTTEPAPGRSGGGWFRRLRPHLRRHRRAFVASLAFAVVGQGLLALLPLVQQVIVDDAVVAERRPLGPWLALMVGLGVVSYGFNYARRSLGGRVGLDVQNDLRIAIHHHLHQLDAARHDALSTGDVMTRATADVTLVQLFLNQLPIIAANVTLLVVALVVMAVLSPLLTLVVAVFVPLFVVVAVRFRDRAFPASWSDQQLAGAVAGVVDEATSGVRVVKRRSPRRTASRRCSRAPPATCSGRGCAPPASRPGSAPRSRRCPAWGSSACWPSGAGWRCGARSRSACSPRSRATWSSW
jgi:ABC-type multidrug transport system fused ATPase/permease subunit